MSGLAVRMSDFGRKLAEYRLGDWKANFQHINYPNVEAALRRILEAEEWPIEYTKQRPNGFTQKYRPKRPTSTDEKIFRIAVLMDTQFESRSHE